MTDFLNGIDLLKYLSELRRRRLDLKGALGKQSGIKNWKQLVSVRKSENGVVKRFQPHLGNEHAFRTGISKRGLDKKFAESPYKIEFKEKPSIHPRKPKGKSRLTDEQVLEARKLISEFTYKQLGEKYGVTYATVRDAVKGITFRHLDHIAKPQK